MEASVPMLEVDYNGSMGVSIPNGLSAEELIAFRDVARDGLFKLNNLVQSDEVGYTKLPEQDLSAIKEFAKNNLRKFNDLVIIGIGGSALGFKAIAEAILPANYNSLSYAERKSFPRYWILNNSDPSIVNSVMKSCEPEDTLVLVLSKSGNTLETLANFTFIYDWLKEANIELSKHIAIVTDHSGGMLRNFAQTANIPIITMPDNVGGRYSVLSAAGLLPAALLGINIDELLHGAKDICAEEQWGKLKVVAAIYIYYMKHGRNINVLMPYSSRLISLTGWFSQLWAESLGKRYNNAGEEIFFGTTPLATTGAVDQHSLLQLFAEGPADKHITFIEILKHCDNERKLHNILDKSLEMFNDKSMGELLNLELRATELSLLKLGVPSIKLSISSLNCYTLGQLFMFFQNVVAIIGCACNINPFDQPGVEEGKNFVYGMLGHPDFKDKKEEFERLYVKHPEFIE